MAVIISGNGIDMGNNPVSNASQIDSTIINENNENVATTSNLVGFKNYIINGNFDIWQRGNSFSSISDSFLIADRWWLDWMGVATGLSASKQPGFTRKNSLYIQRTGGASMQMYQMVENQGNLSNKTFTFSALVKSTTDGTVNFLYCPHKFLLSIFRSVSFCIYRLGFSLRSCRHSFPNKRHRNFIVSFSIDIIYRKRHFVCRFIRSRNVLFPVRKRLHISLVGTERIRFSFF